MFIFQDKSANLTMNFWQSSKTLTVQGNEDMTAKIEEQLDNLINSMNPENAETQSKNTKKLIKQQSVAKTTTNGEAPVSTSVDSADSGKEILALGEAINEIKTLISFQKPNINPINQEAVTEKDTVVTEQGWISDMGIDGPTFVPKSGYFLLIWVKVCPQKLAFS